MARIQLDQDEKAALEALTEADPNSEFWTASYATGYDPGKHGATIVGNSAGGRTAVLRRLCSRKLVDGDPDARGFHRGYSLSDKGREALASQCD